MATAPHEVVASLLRQRCALKCNPSRYIQRLLHGARDTTTHKRKMEVFKVICVAGCENAAAPEQVRVTRARRQIVVLSAAMCQYLSGEYVQELQKFMDATDDATIFTGYDGTASS